MNKWEREFKIAELIAESENQRRFDEFYETIKPAYVCNSEKNTSCAKTDENNKPIIAVRSDMEEY